jgi:hypothetical protein
MHTFQNNVLIQVLEYKTIATIWYNSTCRQEDAITMHGTKKNNKKVTEWLENLDE